MGRTSSRRTPVRLVSPVNRLPSGTVSWEYAPAGGGASVIATGGGVVVVDIPHSALNHSLTGLDESTGKELWTLPVAGSDVCSVTNSQLAVIANSQLAVIDVKTGAQLSYGPSPYAGVATRAALCPDSLPGGQAVAQLQVAQIAQP